MYLWKAINTYETSEPISSWNIDIKQYAPLFWKQSLPFQPIHDSRFKSRRCRQGCLLRWTWFETYGSKQRRWSLFSYNQVYYRKGFIPFLDFSKKLFIFPLLRYFRPFIKGVTLLFNKSTLLWQRRLDEQFNRFGFGVIHDVLCWFFWNILQNWLFHALCLCRVHYV